MIPARALAGALILGGIAPALGANPLLQQAPPPRPFIEDPQGLVLETIKHRVTVEVVASGFETPWAIAFLPDGRLLVTERPGRLRVVNNGQVSAPVKGTPAVHEQQDGGLFDVEVHPEFAKNGWIYLAYAEMLPGFTPPPFEPTPQVPPAAGRGRGRGRGPAVPSMTVVARGRISPSLEWIDHEILFRGSPDLYSNSGSHFGLRFTFDREGHLLYSIGDRDRINDAQDLAKPTGKIHRVNDDGSAPADNPFVGREGALPTIWSYGHRNPQGLAWEPVTGRLWSSEHGPNGGDEVNVIVPGHNYGWPVVTAGVLGGVTTGSAPGMDDPVVSFTPSIGPAGMTFYMGSRFPGWRQTSLFLSGLVGQQLLRLEVTGGRVTGQEVVFNQLGRVRDIAEGPDGYLYVLLQNPTGAGTGVSLSASTPGRLIRLVDGP